LVHRYYRPISDLLNISRYMFFYKHMKFRIEARLCLAIYDFEVHIMLNLCLTFKGTRLPVWEKFNSNVAAKCEYILSDFYWFINLVKGGLVSLANTYNSTGLISWWHKLRLLNICFNFHQKSGSVYAYKRYAYKKHVRIRISTNIFVCFSTAKFVPNSSCLG